MPSHDVTGSSQERATEDVYVIARRVGELEAVLRDVLAHVGVHEAHGQWCDATEVDPWPCAVERARRVLDA